MSNKQLIQSYLPHIPELPGVYRFLDKDAGILYIGKAKNLKNRLSQYGLVANGKTKTMLCLACTIEYTVTDSESSALLLEGQLIKKFKPKFNILLKNNQTFPYIKLRTDHAYPQLVKFRGKNLSDGKFFGPFASADAVDSTLREVHKIFKLRSCSDNYFASRTRPCLEYQIQRCTAPCIGKINKEQYQELVSEVKAFLAGKNQLLQSILAQRMEQHSMNLEYEQAAILRDKIKAISHIQLKSQSSHHLKDVDVIAVAAKDGVFAIQLFLYRHGAPCGNQAYFPVNTTDESTISEVLANFIIQIYQDKVPAKHILLSHNIADKNLYIEVLNKLHHIHTKLSVPKVGAKSQLMHNALYNAELALDKQLKMVAKNTLALQAVATTFNLPSTPNRIEVYDNSHIQGNFPIGAMIVVGQDGFNKKEYRLFNIRESSNTALGGDDYNMLREVMHRRLSKLEPARTPDLMIIDGGQGHMNIVQNIMDTLNVHIPFVCMSKGTDRNSGQEKFHQPDKESFTLDKSLPIMKYLQILRDEAHQFAIKNHRKKRSSAMTVSSLDSIPGIGKTRRRALLNYFGSFKAVLDATVSEITNAQNINTRLAKKIYDFLHNLST